ncbi:MAG: hypothetical protein RIQ41_346 [Candidatus Parcubacteria bacterium]|jgi:hypothetical protein
MSKYQDDVVRSIEDLYTTLAIRQNSRLQRLFGADELPTLVSIIRDLRDYGLERDFENFCRTLRTDFFMFVRLAGFSGKVVREELAALCEVRKSLTEISTLCDGGRIGDGGQDLVAQIQVVILWLRTIEAAFEIIEANLRPNI